jgi:hypothetical protein
LNGSAANAARGLEVFRMSDSGLMQAATTSSTLAALQAETPRCYTERNQLLFM